MESQPIEYSEKFKNGIVNEPVTVLGVAIGGNHWLIRMKDISEVLPLPKIAPVSLTQPWFNGVASLHDNICGIVDLSLYLSGIPTPHNLKNRVLFVSPRFGVNSGLLVSHMLGIRSLSDFSQDTVLNQQAGVALAGCYRDKEEQLWYELDMHKLTSDQTFLQIAV